MLGFVLVYINHKEYTKPMKVTMAKNLGKDCEISLSYRTIRNMGMIPERWPQINTSKFAKRDKDTFDELDLEFEEEVNNLMEEGADQQDIDGEELRL